MSNNKKRVVIKIGTSVLTRSRSARGEGSDFEADANSPLGRLVSQISRLRAQGFEILVVSSGAIGAGMARLVWKKRPDEIRKKQAAAAVGQVALMQVYKKLFNAHGALVAQVLLTRSDIEDRRRYMNARNTLLTLLELGVVPVINENDTVAVDEIKFGDNDRLSALVAAKTDAGLLIILSDVDGLLRSADKKESKVVPVVAEINKDIEALVWKGVKSDLGTGGMASKIEAAKIATASGVTTVIANAFRENILTDIAGGKEAGTKFISLKSLSTKEKWILFGAVPKGEIVVDEGACRALKGLNKSLLPAGVADVKGNFGKGDVVKIKTQGTGEFARGIALFSSQDIEKIKGRKSADLAKLLGRAPASHEVVHRDSLAIIP